MTYIETAIENTNAQPATTPGSDSGQVTRAKAYQGVAPSVAADSFRHETICRATGELGSNMNVRKRCTAGMTSPRSLNRSLTGSSASASAIDVLLTRPLLRSRMVQAKLLTITPTDSGKMSARNIRACTAGRARAMAKATG